VGEGAARLIDAHVHVWRIGANGCTWPGAELRAIHRDFDLADFRAIAPGVDGVLFIQSQEDARDTAWLLGLDDPLIAGVVGWADFAAADAVDRVDALAAHPALRGLRPMAQDRETDWYDHIPDAIWDAMAARNLVLDALVRPRHLGSLARLAARHPDLHIVIDHAAKPESSDFDSWESGMRAIARFANVHCKLSGLVTERVDPSAAFSAIRGAFGPERLLWGSDWPVLTLAASYDEWREMAQRLVPLSDHDAVFDANARRVYRLLAKRRPDGGKGS
jgi:L-fuconolactonase